MTNRAFVRCLPRFVRFANCGFVRWCNCAFVRCFARVIIVNLKLESENFEVELVLNPAIVFSK